jgi:hypothetical protein
MESRAFRAQVYTANPSLSWHIPVTWTSGNVSARDPENDLTVIKPSGTGGERIGQGIVDELGPSSMIPCPCGVLEPVGSNILDARTYGLGVHGSLISQVVKVAAMAGDVPRTVASVMSTGMIKSLSGSEVHADYDCHDSRYGSAVASQGGHR